MITFAERLSVSVPICVAEKENICKTYSFMKQTYFAPIEMLHNILKV